MIDSSYNPEKEDLFQHFYGRYEILEPRYDSDEDEGKADFVEDKKMLDSMVESFSDFKNFIWNHPTVHEKALNILKLLEKMGSIYFDRNNQDEQAIFQDISKTREKYEEYDPNASPTRAVAKSTMNAAMRIISSPVNWLGRRKGSISEKEILKGELVEAALRVQKKEDPDRLHDIFYVFEFLEREEEADTLVNRMATDIKRSDYVTIESTFLSRYAYTPLKRNPEGYSPYGKVDIETKAWSYEDCEEFNHPRYTLKKVLDTLEFTFLSAEASEILLNYASDLAHIFHFVTAHESIERLLIKVKKGEEIEEYYPIRIDRKNERANLLDLYSTKSNTSLLLLSFSLLEEKIKRSQSLTDEGYTFPRSRDTSSASLDLSIPSLSRSEPVNHWSALSRLRSQTPSSFSEIREEEKEVTLSDDELDCPSSEDEDESPVEAKPKEKDDLEEGWHSVSISDLPPPPSGLRRRSLDFSFFDENDQWDNSAEISNEGEKIRLLDFTKLVNYLLKKRKGKEKYHITFYPFSVDEKKKKGKDKGKRSFSLDTF